MLTPLELDRLHRELAGTKVLTVYLDTRVTDPAMRRAWRSTLGGALRAARAGITDQAELAEFDRAAAFLRDPFPPPGGVWGAPGWVAFVTPRGVRYMGDLPVRPASLAGWRDGPVIAPYLRALKQHRAVMVGLVESRSARVYRYAWGRLEAEEELVVPDDETSRGTRSASFPAPRGAVSTEAARRRRLADFERLATTLGERLARGAGAEGWVLVGGTPEWAHHAFAALPRGLQGRALLSTALDHDAPEVEIARAARRAGSELRAAQGAGLVRQLLDQAGGAARAVAGVPAVQRALRAGAVDVLLVSPALIAEHERDAEDAVRAAIAQGADVEVPSGEAAAELDGAAAGIAARLRFPIDEPLAHAGAPAGRAPSHDRAALGAAPA